VTQITQLVAENHATATRKSNLAQERRGFQEQRSLDVELCSPSQKMSSTSRRSERIQQDEVIPITARTPPRLIFWSGIVALKSAFPVHGSMPMAFMMISSLRQSILSAGLEIS
jgi:hypothetical protein